MNIKAKEAMDDNFKINEVNASFKKSAKFAVEQNVMYLNHYKSHVKWIPAKVVQVVSLYTYLIRVYGNIRFVHENQLKNSTLSDYHHNPRGSILLPVPNKPILKDKVKRGNSSDDEVEKRVKFDEVVTKQRSLSLSEGVQTDYKLNRPKRKVIEFGQE